MALKPLLREHEAASILKLSVRTLQSDRVKGGKIPFCKIGRRVMYRPDDIESFIASRIVGSTTEADQLADSPSRDDA